jgi:hypothetical protein
MMYQTHLTATSLPILLAQVLTDLRVLLAASAACAARTNVQ